MVLGVTHSWCHTKLPFSFLEIGNFQNVDPIAFGYWTLLSNEIHCVSLKPFQLKNVTIKPQQKIVQERFGMIIVYY